MLSVGLMYCGSVQATELAAQKVRANTYKSGESTSPVNQPNNPLMSLYPFNWKEGVITELEKQKPQEPFIKDYVYKNCNFYGEVVKRLTDEIPESLRSFVLEFAAVILNNQLEIGENPELVTAIVLKTLYIALPIFPSAEVMVNCVKNKSFSKDVEYSILLGAVEGTLQLDKILEKKDFLFQGLSPEERKELIARIMLVKNDVNRYRDEYRKRVALR